MSGSFSRTYGRKATKVYSGRGADIVMQSLALAPIPIGRLRRLGPTPTSAITSELPTLPFPSLFSLLVIAALNVVLCYDHSCVGTHPVRGKGRSPPIYNPFF